MDVKIARKYEMEKRLGKGAYGIVWRARSKRSGRVVAVKKIFDAFRNRTDAQRTFREIVFLRAFSDHPNIVKLLNVHRAENDRDLYLVFEFMNTDLHHVIRKGNILLDIHKRFIMYQMFRATHYLHSGNVIHRDQKPSNILLDSECNCKIADFGLARSISAATGAVPSDAAAAAGDHPDAAGCLTDYVATRWYRAPEILVGSKSYTKGVDMWSLGCILGEMLVGRPLFPGRNTLDQLDKIYVGMGFPKGSGKGAITAQQHEATAAPPANAKAKIDDLLTSADSDAVHLMKQLLQLPANQRMTAGQALRHPYVSRFHNARDHVMKRSVIPPLDDAVQLSVEQYKEKLYDIIRANKH